MKKIHIIIGILSIIMIYSFINYLKMPEEKEIINNSLEYLSSDKILDIAIHNANMTKENCTLITNNVNFKDSIPIYTTIFNCQNRKYQYEINGFTGDIISIVKSK